MCIPDQCSIILLLLLTYNLDWVNITDKVLAVLFIKYCGNWLNKVRDNVRIYCVLNCATAR